MESFLFSPTRKSRMRGAADRPDLKGVSRLSVAFFIARKHNNARLFVGRFPYLKGTHRLSRWLRGQGKGFSSSKRQYTKKLRCAKLNVRLATVHKGKHTGGRFDEKSRKRHIQFSTR